MVRYLSVIIMVWAALTQSALADGVRAASENFRLISDAAVDADAILTDLEAFQQAVIADLDLDIVNRETPLRISIFDDPDTFTALAPAGLTAAVYLRSAAGHDIIIGHRAEPNQLLSDMLDPAGLQLVLRHETVHHILESYYSRKLPVWLSEGLAEYYATYSLGPDGRVTFGRALPEQEPLTEAQTWLPMRIVIENLAKYPDFRRASAMPPSRAQRIYYGQSWALTHFIMDQPEGLARVHRFVDGWTPAIDSEDSFERAFGLRYEPLETRVREDIIRDGGRMRLRQTERQPPVAVTLAAATAQDLTVNRLRLLLSHGADTHLTYDQIEAAYDALETPPETIEFDLASAVRAWRMADWESADDATDRILTRTPNHPLALKIRAKTAYGRVSERQSQQALWDAAEAATIRGLAAQPDDAELHLFRVAVSLPVTQNISPGAQISLDWLKTHETHLRLPHAAMMMIPALIYENQFDEADRVLDSAALWNEKPDETWVIDRLRRVVAAERLDADNMP